MSKVLRWIAHGMLANVSTAARRRGTGDLNPVFEQIDAGHLSAGDFRVSASMGFGDAPALSDFAETLPACRHGLAVMRGRPGSSR